MGSDDHLQSIITRMREMEEKRKNGYVAPKLQLGNPSYNDNSDYRPRSRRA